MATCVQHGEWGRRFLACPKCFKNGDPSVPLHDRPRPNYDAFGYALAARVLQSDLYAKLDDRERGECDAMIQAAQRPSIEPLAAFVAAQRDLPPEDRDAIQRLVGAPEAPIDGGAKHG